LARCDVVPEVAATAPTSFGLRMQTVMVEDGLVWGSVGLAVEAAIGFRRYPGV